MFKPEIFAGSKPEKILDVSKPKICVGLKLANFRFRLKGHLSVNLKFTTYFINLLSFVLHNGPTHCPLTQVSLHR